jgi:hypothetical protein
VPDWKALVRDRLGTERLGSQDEEVLAELAAHLEDVCADTVAGGSLNPRLPNAYSTK